MPRWAIKMSLEEKKQKKSEYDKQRRILKREEFAAYQKEYRKTPGYRERQNISNRKYRANNKEKISIYGKQYRSKSEVIDRRKEWTHNDYLKNKDYKLSYGKKYYKENKEYVSQRSKVYNQRPEVKKKTIERISKNRKRINEASKRYRSRNKGKVRAWGAKRRAALLKRLPSWADLKAIENFYKNRPKGYEVDHIIPLQGRNISGFHVIENLQYLTEKEHSYKLNKFDFNKYKNTEHFKKWARRLKATKLQQEK